MARVRCYECKKSYNYHEDAFCPRCGCFNQPPRASRIDANGNLVYHDGINESNHTGSFVHKEYHKENFKRAFTDLESKQPKVQIHIPQEIPGLKKAARNKKAAPILSLFGIIYAVFFILIFLTQFF